MAAPAQKSREWGRRDADYAGFLARADDSSSDWDDRDEDDRTPASDATESWAIA